MLKQLFQLATYLLLTTVVLCVEQLYGLPIVALALIILFNTFQRRWYRQVWLVVIGLLLAGLYQLPLAGGVVFVSVLVGAWYVFGTFLKNSTLRVLLISSGGAVILLVLVPLSLSPTVISMAVVSEVLLIILMRLILFIPETTGKGNIINSTLRM